MDKSLHRTLFIIFHIFLLVGFLADRNAFAQKGDVCASYKTPGKWPPYTEQDAAADFGGTWTYKLSTTGSCAYSLRRIPFASIMVLFQNAEAGRSLLKYYKKDPSIKVPEGVKTPPELEKLMGPEKAAEYMQQVKQDVNSGKAVEGLQVKMVPSLGNESYLVTDKNGHSTLRIIKEPVSVQVNCLWKVTCSEEKLTHIGQKIISNLP